MSQLGSRKDTQSSLASSKQIGKDNIQKQSYRSLKRDNSSQVLQSQASIPVNLNDDGIPDIDLYEHKHLFQKTNFEISQLADFIISTSPAPRKSFDRSKINGDNYSKQYSVNDPDNDLTDNQNLTFSKAKNNIQNPAVNSKVANLVFEHLVPQKEFTRNSTEKTIGFGGDAGSMSRQQTLPEFSNMEQHSFAQSQYLNASPSKRTFAESNRSNKYSNRPEELDINKKTYSTMKRSDSPTKIACNLADKLDMSPDFGNHHE